MHHIYMRLLSWLTNKIYYIFQCLLSIEMLCDIKNVVMKMTLTNNAIHLKLIVVILGASL
jgi:hypothetical protein